VGAGGKGVGGGGVEVVVSFPGFVRKKLLGGFVLGL
jgi:hypothetical protein